MNRTLFLYSIILGVILMGAFNPSNVLAIPTGSAVGHCKCTADWGTSAVRNLDRFSYESRSYYFKNTQGGIGKCLTDMGQICAPQCSTFISTIAVDVSGKWQNTGYQRGLQDLNGQWWCQPKDDGRPEPAPVRPWVTIPMPKIVSDGTTNPALKMVLQLKSAVAEVMKHKEIPWAIAAVASVLVVLGGIKVLEAAASGGALAFEPATVAVCLAAVLAIATKAGISVPAGPPSLPSAQVEIKRVGDSVQGFVKVDDGSLVAPEEIDFRQQPV